MQLFIRLYLKIIILTLIFYCHLLNSNAQANCQTLSFVSVSPIGSSKEEPCDWNMDSQKCRIQKGYRKFGKVELSNNKTAYTLTSAILDPENLEEYGLQFFILFYCPLALLFVRLINFVFLLELLLNQKIFVSQTIYTLEIRNTLIWVLYLLILHIFK